MYIYARNVELPWSHSGDCTAFVKQNINIVGSSPTHGSNFDIDGTGAVPASRMSNRVMNQYQAR